MLVPPQRWPADENFFLKSRTITSEFSIITDHLLNKAYIAPTTGTYQCSTALPAGQMRFENPLDELVIQSGGGILGEMNINGIAQCNERNLENVNSTEHNLTWDSSASVYTKVVDNHQTKPSMCAGLSLVSSACGTWAQRGNHGWKCAMTQ